MIDEGITLYPNKILIEKAVSEGNIGKVGKLLQSFTPANFEKIKEYLARLKLLEKIQRTTRPVSRPASRPKATAPKSKAHGIVKLPLRADKDDAKTVREFEEAITYANKQFLDSVKQFHKVGIVR